MNRFFIFWVGVAIVAGFFMPWFEIPKLGVVSGWDLVRFDILPETTRMVIALCPIGGGTLSLAALTRSSAAESLALLIGLSIPGYASYHALRYIGDILGQGLWIVIIASALALVLGILNKNNDLTGSRHQNQ